MENRSSDSTIHKIITVGKYSRRYNEKRPDARDETHGKAEPDGRPGSSCYFCGGEYTHSRGRNSCPAYGKRCNNYKIFNHFAKYCPKCKHGDKVDQVPDSTESASTDDEYVYCLHCEYINNVNAKIDVRLENNPVNFQKDSGASGNAINDKEFKYLGSNVKLHKNSVKL